MNDLKISIVLILVILSVTYFGSQYERVTRLDVGINQSFLQEQVKVEDSEIGFWGSIGKWLHPAGGVIDLIIGGDEDSALGEMGKFWVKVSTFNVENLPNVFSLLFIFINMIVVILAVRLIRGVSS